MTLSSLDIGDIVEVDKKGRRFHAIVESYDGKELTIKPIPKGISFLTATAREVIGIYRKAKGSA